VTDLKYHVIWVTKYRYKILRGDIAERARDLIRQICVAREVTIIRGAVSPDHVHMLVGAPPQLAPSKLVQFIKGRSSRLLQREFPALRKRYWGQHLWARGYYSVATIRRLVTFYVHEHNHVLPHSAFRGQTPDEMYFGTGETVPGDLTSRATAARRARIEANRATSCRTCPSLSAA
jgi:putative transposase